MSLARIAFHSRRSATRSSRKLYFFFLNSLISQGRCHLDERELYDTDKTIPMTLCEEFYSVRQANDNNQISTFTVYVLRWSC